MRKRKLPVPRYVNPASIDVGDVIRITWKEGDVEHTLSGEVGAIHGRTLSTSQGLHLLTWVPGKMSYRVTLLAKAEAAQTPLFEYSGGAEGDAMREVRERAL